ncbi:MAG: flippase-like domain-containing protein [Candidatus Sericytochromatia bacterium]
MSVLPKKHPRFKQGLRWGLILLVLLGLGFLLNQSFQAQAFQSLLLQAHYPWLIAGAGLVLFELLLKALRLRILAHPFAIEHSFRNWLRIQVLGIALATVTPGRLGEVAKVFLMAEKTPDKWGLSLLLCLFERLLDFLVLCLLGFLLSLSLLPAGPLPLLLGLLLGFLLLGFFSFLRFQQLWLKILPLLPAKIQPILQDYLHHREKLLPQLLPVLLLTCLIWFLNACFQWLLLFSIGKIVSLWIVTGINAILSLAGILALLPLGLGTTDLGAFFLYRQLLSLSTESILFLMLASRAVGLSVLFGLALPFGLKDLRKREFSPHKT